MIRDLTDDERAVLNDIVVDGDNWWAEAQGHSIVKYGDTVKAESDLDAKVSRHRPLYESRKDDVDYKNRAARDAAALAEG